MKLPNYITQRKKIDKHIDDQELCFGKVCIVKKGKYEGRIGECIRLGDYKITLKHEKEFMLCNILWVESL
jgi:hypothetical protein